MAVLGQRQADRHFEVYELFHRWRSCRSAVCVYWGLLQYNVFGHVGDGVRDDPDDLAAVGVEDRPTAVSPLIIACI